MWAALEGIRIWRGAAGAVLTIYTSTRAKLVSDGQGAWGREQNCRAGASPADPSNGKRERLPYKSVIGREADHETTDNKSRGQKSEVRDQKSELRTMEELEAAALPQ